MIEITSRETIVDELSVLMESLPLSCPYTLYDDSLDLIFSSKVKSYREVLLLCFVVKSMDPDYNPYEDFYSCNPRTLAEGPLNDFFNKYRIPHTKSGPLNILKAHTINEAWLKQRDDRDAAECLFDLAVHISEDIPYDFDTIFCSILFRFKELSKSVESLKISAAPCSDPVVIYKCLKKMIDEATDGGNTPQQIASMLLSSYFESLGVPNRLEGGSDSAFSTNTTSKKPGDMVEIDPATHSVCKVYEVTVKRFDQKRLYDSIDSIKLFDNHGFDINEVIVLCRNEDALVGDRIRDPCISELEVEGVTYVFQDIYNWIFNKLISMSNDARIGFFNRFNDYVNSFNTAIPVKEKWKETVSIFVNSSNKQTIAFFGSTEL